MIRTDGAVLGPLRQAFGGEAVAGLGEGELLDRFYRARDEPSFAALVARHGPMVLGVCRRMLADPVDAEDAFQATFLVLVRRGRTLRDRDRLAPWLFGVARKVATRARVDADRRRARLRPLDAEPAAGPGADDHRAELARALVEEIDRLPDSLRGPVVLCCAEGSSYEAAAERLGCTAAAVRGRLARARDRLRVRLVRRGFAPAAGTRAAWSGSDMARALMVPMRWIEATTRAAAATAAGPMAAAGIVPAGAATLAEGASRAMIATKWKFLAAGATTLGIASGVGALAQQATPTVPATPSATTVPAPSARAEPATVDVGEGSITEDAKPSTNRKRTERRADGSTVVTTTRTVTETGPDGQHRPMIVEETETIPAGRTVVATETRPATPEPVSANATVPVLGPESEARAVPPSLTPEPLPTPAVPAPLPTPSAAQPSLTPIAPAQGSRDADLVRIQTLELQIAAMTNAMAAAASRATAQPGVPDATEAPTTPEMPEPPAPPQPPQIAEVSPPADFELPPPGEGGAPGVHLPRPGERGDGRTMVARIAAIEARLGQIESRFAQLERQIGIQTSNPAPPPAQAPYFPANPSRRTVPMPEAPLAIPRSTEPRDVRPLENYRPRPN